jgi:uncharacterized protein involved in response to NO
MSAGMRRAYAGPALFSFGFRPFFLFGALWAALAAPLWALAYLAWGGQLFGAAGLDWHIHEMLFGYLAAVIAGFLLTAVPNWTGRLPVIGAPLAALFGLWVAGRSAMLLRARLGLSAGAIDALFLVVLAAVLWREVIAGRNWRNAPVCALVTLLAGANICFDLRAWSPLLADAAMRLGLAAPAVLMAIVGGRIVPSFTGNWLAQHRIDLRPAKFGMLDRAVLLATGLGLAVWIVWPTSPAGGVLLALAGLDNLARLSRWRGRWTGEEPLVWVLHAGYGWLGVALTLLGASMLAPDFVPLSAAIHALTVGAFGVMTLAVMTRATLGHTGRPRAAGRGTLMIYVAVNLAALLRVSAAFPVPFQSQLLAAGAAAWSAAFLGFAIVYGPMLARPRLS